MARLPKNFRLKTAWKCGDFATMQKGRRLGSPREKSIRANIYCVEKSCEVEPSWSAMERVSGVCSAPVWRVVTVSMRAIQVSSVAEVL